MSFMTRSGRWWEVLAMKTLFDVKVLIEESCYKGRELTECRKVGLEAVGVCCYMHEIARDMLLRGGY